MRRIPDSKSTAPRSLAHRIRRVSRRVVWPYHRPSFSDPALLRRATLASQSTMASGSLREVKLAALPIQAESAKFQDAARDRNSTSMRYSLG